MRRSKRSENKRELLKETKTACAYLSERSSKRAVITKNTINRQTAFENFTRTEKANLENLHKLGRVKTFSEYLLKMPKFFDEPEFYLDYHGAVREINTTLYARLILIGLHFWLYVSILASGGDLLATEVYILSVPLLVLLLFRRDLNNLTGN